MGEGWEAGETPLNSLIFEERLSSAEALMLFSEQKPASLQPWPLADDEKSKMTAQTLKK